VAALLRRRVVLLIALALLAAVPALALSNGQAVIDDFNDNGQIDRCYSAADFQQALDQVRSEQQQYGAIVDVIRQAQITNLRMAGRPCPRPLTASSSQTPADAQDDGGSSSTWIWIVVGVAVAAAASVAGVLVYRRRGGGGEAGA
jgi:hypothetical protein